MMAEIERSASVIATEINTIKRQTAQSCLAAALEIGKRLHEAKALVAHGEWQAWLAENVDYSVSTANNLMKLQTEYGEQDQLTLFSTRRDEIFGALSPSKALALTKLPEEARAEFVQENDMEKLSVRELNAKVEALRAALQKEQDERAAQTMDAAKRAEELRKKADSAAAGEAKAAAQLEALKKKETASGEKLKALKDRVVELEAEQAQDRGGHDADEAELRQAIEAQTRSALQKEYEEKLQKLNARMDGTTWRMQTLIDILQSTWEQILSTLDDCANAETAQRIQSGLREMLQNWLDGLNKGQ